ncbi:hypothetical protein [Prosthecobacter sp.]|uniref:hypothetical protein n=1 Tax=Prosthecobacter sp. TaxID=1965333 RepID=UPI003784440E
MKNIEWMMIVMVLWHASVLRAQEPVKHVHQEGKIRVFYQLEGQHAVDATDANKSGVPDQVEDLLTQIVAARTMFVEVLGFPDPLLTERFRTASFIDVSFRHKDVLKSNGVAYDELQRYNRAGDPKGTLSISFTVATSVKAATNLTPAHEFFHLIQNSVTYFKNKWYSEGTARWSEKALGIGGLGPAKILSAWPLPEEQEAAVYGMAYEAADQFWNPLAAKADDEGVIPEVPALARVKEMRYTDGTPVLKDLKLTGWEFIREVLQALDRADDVAFRELGYERWSEENQRSPKNNAYIMKSIEDVLAKR